MLIKVGTYNIKHGGSLGKNCQDIAMLIAQEKLDIVGLQELDRGIGRSNNQDILKTIANYAQYPYYTFYKAIDYGSGDYGLGIMSKFPFETKQVIQLPHSLEQRILVEASFYHEEQLISFFVTHLELGSYELIRREQFSVIKEQVKDKESFILVGDFNVGDWTQGIFEYSEFLGEYNLINNPQNIFYTFHSDYNKDDIKAIDNIITSNNFNVISTYMINNNLSDHNLLVAQLRLKNNK